jgi:outer membrane receptor protein involved in Fe transport
MIIPNGQNADLTIITRTLDRRIRQPNLIANAALFYSKGGFEARVAYNVTDKFLLSLTQEEARYEQVDASVKYDLNDHFQVSLQGRNLLGADRRQISSVANFGLLFGETDIGPSYHLSVSFKY